VRGPRSGHRPNHEPPALPHQVTPLTPGKPITISYDVTPYENSCRPDAPVCGCGTRCPFDNGGHTAPFYELSAALIVYAR
jgi:hypothetical protein